MKRKKWLSLALCVGLIGALTLGGCGNGNGGSENKDGHTDQETQTDDTGAAEDTEDTSSDTTDYGPALKLTMGSTGAAEDISTQSAQKFCDLVKERSGGQIEIELFPASQLGSATDQLEMVSNGSIDLFLEANLMTTYGVDNLKPASIMFSTRGKEDQKKLMGSDYMQKNFDEFCEKSGIRVVAYNWYRNATAIASVNKIEKLEDCAGVKLRVPPVNSTVDMFNQLGFNATPVSYNETLISMQQKVIDAVWCTEDAIWTMGFYEPANYVFELNAAADCMYVYANDNLFSSTMTDAQRELIRECAEDAGDYYTELAEGALEENRKNWEDAGVETVTITEEEQERWAEIFFEYAKKQEAAGEWDEGLFEEVLSINGYSAD